MKIPKINKREEVKIVRYLYCPLCKKELKGTSNSQLEYNLKLHLEKHEKEKKK